jgi:hypothetical protein
MRENNSSKQIDSIHISYNRNGTSKIALISIWLARRRGKSKCGFVGSNVEKVKII